MCCKPGTNTRAGLQVHHIFPFHYCIALGRPDLELDDRNLITLCEDDFAAQSRRRTLALVSCAARLAEGDAGGGSRAKRARGLQGPQDVTSAVVGRSPTRGGG